MTDFFSHGLPLKQMTSQQGVTDSSCCLLACCLRKIASVLLKMWYGKYSAEDHAFAKITLANNESFLFLARREAVVDLDEEEKETFTIEKFSETSHQLAADQPRV